MTFTFAFNGLNKTKNKGGPKNMEPVCLIFTICGAATLTGGIMKAVERMEK